MRVGVRAEDHLDLLRLGTLRTVAILRDLQRSTATTVYTGEHLRRDICGKRCGSWNRVDD